MKILVLFDLARRVDPVETFSERALKEEDKPTEADVLRCLKHLGRMAARSGRMGTIAGTSKPR